MTRKQQSTLQLQIIMNEIRRYGGMQVIEAFNRIDGKLEKEPVTKKRK